MKLDHSMISNGLSAAFKKAGVLQGNADDPTVLYRDRTCWYAGRVLEDDRVPFHEAQAYNCSKVLYSTLGAM